MATIFDTDKLHAIAKDAAGLKDRQAACAQIIRDLKLSYPDHIRDDIPWLFNNAGGAMGQMKFLHASLSEYLILFGTPIGTEGHSGRYSTEVWDFIFDGEIWGYEAGALERNAFGPGDVHYLGKGGAEGYAIPEAAFMLEYARGPIPSMVAFGLFDSIFSTIDARTLGNTARYYTMLMFAELRKGKV